MKIAISNHWFDRKSAVFWNKDGIMRMFQVLRDRDGWETRMFKLHDKTFEWTHDCIDISFSPDPLQQVKDWKPDVILFFGDFSHKYLADLKTIGVPVVQHYSGGRFRDFAHVPDLVFTESKSYVPWMKEIGVKKVIQAFGTNTELFKPMDMPKFWDGFFPATGATWKRHGLFAEALGSRGLVCGWWQPHEPMPLMECLKWKTGILHHQMPESLLYLYNMSHTVVVTSEDIGGSQRTVLEALSMNIPTIVMNDSTMTSEYVREAGEGEICEPNIHAIREAVEKWKGKKTHTRDWVMKNYSEYVYADKVRDGIMSII